MKIEDDENLTSTKKIKSDMDAMFSNMEQEFEAGKSKLAKLRERIRKAKGVIKDVDSAMAKSS